MIVRKAYHLLVGRMMKRLGLGDARTKWTQLEAKEMLTYLLTLIEKSPRPTLPYTDFTSSTLIVLLPHATIYSGTVHASLPLNTRQESSSCCNCSNGVGGREPRSVAGIELCWS